MTAEAVIVTGDADLPVMRRVLEVAVAVFDLDDPAHVFALELLEGLDRTRKDTR